jgi:putative acetyltransferase
MRDAVPAFFQLRAAQADDGIQIARVWHDSWHEAHASCVPAALLAHRGFDSFRARVSACLAATTVALRDARVIGFVSVHEDEVAHLFVTAAARGSGVAGALLDAAEQVIARSFAVAWFAVVVGNARASRFYERRGWRQIGPIAYDAEVAGGTIPVASLRYEKVVRS